MDDYNFHMGLHSWADAFDPYLRPLDDNLPPPMPSFMDDDPPSLMPSFMNEEPAAQPQPPQPAQPEQPIQPQATNQTGGPYFPTPLSSTPGLRSAAFRAALSSNSEDRNVVPYPYVAMEQVAPNPEERVVNELLPFLQASEQQDSQQIPPQVVQQPQPQQQQPCEDPKPRPQQEPQMDDNFPNLTALAQTRAYYNNPTGLGERYKNKGSWPLLGDLIDIYEALPDSEKPSALRAGIFDAKAIGMQVRRAANKLDGWRPRFGRGRRAGSGENKVSKRVELYHDKLTCTALNKLLGPLPPDFIALLNDHEPHETKKQKARATNKAPNAQHEAQQPA